ncbi:zinc finger protein 687a isoform X2 [Denticeps clupeoides]|uniref:zinc finger protein 687a isoform X2 n=1 Tax=Denticeps clupeoides TaxID=299321 RepID=UPI0010A33F1E|nr:zinc finger protein 687a-like isoform X2 [Denticeps clupeoides]
MGDMKTPDFDDLLAAFDIPDIDAKEAIQSAPEDSDGHHNAAGGVVKTVRSPSPLGHQQAPSTQAGDPPGVSVIVKNRVRADVLEVDGDACRDQLPDGASAGVQGGLGGAHLVPFLEPKIQGLVPSEPLIQNETEVLSAGPKDPLLRPTTSQSQSNGQLWSPASPKAASEGGSGHSSGAFDRVQSLMAQNPGSLPRKKPRKLQEGQEMDGDDLTSSAQAAATFLPSSISLPIITPSSSSSVSGLHVSQNEDETPSLGLGAGLQIDSDEESELDLNSPPLVIQESPDPLHSPPKFPRRHCRRRSSSEMFSSPSPSSPPPLTNPVGRDSSVLPHPPSPKCAPVEERNPEHVIEERDSPESPEPELPSTSLLQAGHATSDQSKAPQPSDQPEEEGPGEEDPMESEDSEVEASKTEKAEDEKMEVEEADRSSITTPPSRIKVRIKTVKTPTGTITRTVTRVAPKSTSPNPTTKGPNRPKRLCAPLPGSKGTNILPVSTLQDASAAMLAAASKAQNKMAVTPRLSATAVSITKTTVLPSISASSVRAAAAATAAVVKPASIVNSPGAVISRSQSSLVEAFNKILNSKNLLPSYRPDLSAAPPPEWGLPIPASGYRCLECGDAFALERSLARHYDRRSLRIEVTCNHCAKRLVFFNKCSLLLHARDHKDKGLVMQCSHLIMRPVSVEQMIAQHEASPLYPAAEPPLLLLPLSCKKAGPLQYFSKCPECKGAFSGKPELIAHFQEVVASSNFSCTQCTPPMLLPNPCSWAAHQRIHKRCAPHVCPECGGSARQTSFHTHLQEACLHFSRRIGYRCCSCQVVYGGLNSVKSHIHTSHCEVFHKCPTCPMAFKSASSAQAHMTTQHPALTSAQAKMIFKCVMCDTVFTQKTSLHVHFDSHLANQKVHVFKCPECNKLYAQRASMLEHVKSVHRDASLKPESATPALLAAAPSLSTLKMESSDGEDWGREHDEEDGEMEKELGDNRATQSCTSWRCTQCQSHYTDKEHYISHMAEQHDKVLKKFPCAQCEGSFSSSSSLRRHVRIKHTGIQRTFHCPLCVDSKRSFTTRLLLEKHVQEHHGGRAERLV